MSDDLDYEAVVVTAITDLSKNGTVPRRSINEYLRLGEHVLSLKVPLVVFCDDNLTDTIRNRRNELAPDHLTITKPINLLSQWESEWERVDELLSTRRSASLGNPLKDTTDYTFVGWSKWHWMHSASEIIESNGYWWIDFGITHVAEWPKHLEDALHHAWIYGSSHNVVIPSLEKDDVFLTSSVFSRYVASIQEDSTQWLINGSPTVAGGVFGIRRDHITSWRDEMEMLRHTSLSHGTVVSDQLLMSWYAATHQKTTRIIPSHYQSLLADLALDIPLHLTTLFGAPRIIDLPNFLGEGWSPMNPSIAEKEDGEYLVSVRHVNYEYKNDVYIPLDNSDIIKTRNVLIELDRHFNVVSSSEIDDSRCCGAQLFPVFGLEDMRIFKVNEYWMASTTMREHRSDGRCEIVVARLNGNVLTSSAILPSPLPNRHEKNWMPLHGHDRCEWVWNINPPIRVVLDDITDSFVVHPAVSALTPTPLRGGSQLISWGEGWLCVTHDVRWNQTPNGNRREYRHYLVLVSRDFSTVQVSRPFIFEHSGIEFCAGVASTPHGIVMSYGIEDKSARLMELPRTQVETLFS